MAVDGVIRLPVRSEPPTPPAGKVYVWLDSTVGKLRQKDDVGTVSDFIGPSAIPVNMAAVQVDKTNTLALTTTPQPIFWDTPTSVETNTLIIEHLDSDSERLSFKETSNYHGTLSLLITNNDSEVRTVTLTLVHSVVGPLSSRSFNIPATTAGYSINRPFIIPETVPVGYAYIELSAQVNSQLVLEAGARAAAFQLRGERGEKGDKGDTGDNTKVLISSNDTQEGYLIDKIVPGSSRVSVTELNDGANETLAINVVESQINHANLQQVGSNTHAQIDSHIANVANPHGTTKSHIGLGDVDNTSDINKPVSTAQSAAITSAKDRSQHTGTQVASTISDLEYTITNNTSVLANSAKVTNATHTGEITGTTALTLDKSAITNRSSVSIAPDDFILITDTSDGDNLKKATAQSLVSTIVYGTQYTFSSSVAESSTTSVGWVQKLRMTTGSLPAGDYRLSYTFMVTNSNANRLVSARVVQDGSTELARYDHKMGDGNFYRLQSSFSHVTLSVGIHTFDVDFGQVDVGTGKIKEVKIELVRIS